MPRPHTALLLLVPFTFCLLSACGGPSAKTQPSLVVVITVDGLGADLLTRHDGDYVGGLRRLLDEGRTFPNGWVDHGITVSHPGHVTIATGLHPSHHGIVDAAFAMADSGGFTVVDAVSDPSVPILGAPDLEGASPRLIEAPTLAEWFQDAEPDARVLSIGGGRHSSLLHAGHAHGDTYWFDRDVGRFVTSAAYADQPESWVDDFNNGPLLEHIEAAKTWRSVIPRQVAEALGPDSRPFEADGEHTTFPHLYSVEMSPDPDEEFTASAKWFTWGPFLDKAVLDLARRGVRERAIGQRRVRDVLNIVLSQTDSITHYYGPDSHEMADALFRLDRELGSFFDDLDETVGAGRWLCVLTADHGMAQIAEQRLALGLPARRLEPEEIEEILEPLRGHIDDPETIAAALRQKDVIAAVYTAQELESSGSTDPYLELYRHSWRRDRVARIPLFSLTTWDAPIAQSGLLVRLTEGTAISLDVVIHGSPYDYDRRVPVIFIGPGVPAGMSAEPARTVDIAPTLASLAGVPIPSDLDGRVLFR